MTLTLEQKKAKAEELLYLCGKFKALESGELEGEPDEELEVSHEITALICANPFEQWFLEALEEARILREENFQLKMQRLNANEFHEKVETACEGYYRDSK